MTAIDLMDAVDARVVPFANPCPSRDEWTDLRGHVQRLERVVAAIGVSVPETFGALWSLSQEVAEGLRYPEDPISHASDESQNVSSTLSTTPPEEGTT